MKKIFILIIAVMLIAGLTGCGEKTGFLEKKGAPSSPSATESSTKSDVSNQLTDKEKTKWKAALYFSDKDAMYLIKEERDILINASGTSTSAKLETAEKAKLCIEELIKGPVEKALSPSIPKDTKVLSVTQDKDTLIVDLSKEYIQNNPGGSTGETMAIAPIVLTLTELESIEQVGFKIQGKQQIDFKGHFTLDKPFKRSEFEQYIKK